MASCAPACCICCAMAHAMLRLLATPNTTAVRPCKLFDTCLVPLGFRRWPIRRFGSPGLVPRIFVHAVSGLTAYAASLHVLHQQWRGTKLLAQRLMQIFQNMQ